MNTKHLVTGLLSVLVLVLLAGLAGCKEGPEGPQGPAGKDASVVSFEGFAADIKCGKCHDADQDTVNYVWARKYQWEQSKHFYGGDYERAGTSCAGCHTTEGFINAVRGGTANATVSTSAAVVQPSPPGCFACHAPHANGSFALRTQAPVTLLSNVTGDANAVFDYGKGNLCVSCHKPRSATPKMAANVAGGDTITITNTRWYSHYGVQGQMLVGTGGYKWSDYTGYVGGNSGHTAATLIKSEGCTQCHMADIPSTSSYPFGLAGGHTMNIGYDWEGSRAFLLQGCKNSACHPSITSVDYHGVQSTVEAYMDTLHGLLLAKGYIDSTGSIKASSGTPLKITPARRAGALWNYMFVEHDLSEGVHNSVYTIDLLKSSVAELRK